MFNCADIHVFCQTVQCRKTGNEGMRKRGTGAGIGPQIWIKHLHSPLDHRRQYNGTPQRTSSHTNSLKQGILKSFLLEFDF